jgi:hypothetical protein
VLLIRPQRVVIDSVEVMILMMMLEMSKMLVNLSMFLSVNSMLTYDVNGCSW